MREIPVRCVSCGNILADKYQCYLDLLREQCPKDTVEYYQTDNKHNVKSISGQILDDLEITNSCCRVAMFTQAKR